MFIHGLGGSSSNWYPLIQLTKVEERFRVVRFDFAGHGNSPAGGVTESIDSLVQEVEYVLDHIGAENAILVAHSMGGVSARRRCLPHSLPFISTARRNVICSQVSPKSVQAW